MSDAKPQRAGWGLGNVYSRRGRWYLRYSINGRQVREGIKIPVGADAAASEIKARQFLKRRQEEIAKGTFVPKQNRLMLDETLDAFLANSRLSGRRRVEGTASVLRHVRAFFKGYRAFEVTEEKLDAYVLHRQREDAAPASITRELAHLRAALKLAARRKQLASVPYFPTLKFDNRRTGFIEPQQFEALRAELPDELRDFATFLYLSAWRPKEVKTLTWGDVFLGQGEIRLRSENSKTHQLRTLPLFGELREVVEHRAAARRLDVPWVFARANGKPIGQISETWKAAAQRAGLGPMVAYACRYSGVRNLVRAGVPERVAMDWSGHKTRSVFDRYNVTSGEDLANAAELLNAYVSGQ
jgi:integrase